MPTCCLPKCFNTEKSRKQFFRIPKRADLNVQWCDFLKKNNVMKITENLRVCEDHFSQIEISGELVLATIPSLYEKSNENEVFTFTIYNKLLIFYKYFNSF